LAGDKVKNKEKLHLCLWRTLTIMVLSYGGSWQRWTEL